MVTLVGMDYERGLSMLNDLTKDGKVHSKLDFTGERIFEGYQY